MEIKFTEEECQSIITYSLTLSKNKSSDLAINTKNSYEYRTIIKIPETKWIFDKMLKFFTEYTGIPVFKSLEEVYVHTYYEGDSFSRHSDQSYALHSVGVCLNSDYEGGEFVLYNPDNTLPKETGLIYTFDSTRQHQILEVKKGIRWSMIGFLQLGHVGYNNTNKLI